MSSNIDILSVLTILSNSNKSIKKTVWISSKKDWLIQTVFIAIQSVSLRNWKKWKSQKDQRWVCKQSGEGPSLEILDRWRTFKGENAWRTVRVRKLSGTRVPLMGYQWGSQIQSSSEQHIWILCWGGLLIRQDPIQKGWKAGNFHQGSAHEFCWVVAAWGVFTWEIQPQITTIPDA